jgi:hypothetical protein
VALPTISSKQRRRLSKASRRSETNKNIYAIRKSIGERAYWLFMIGIVLLIFAMLIMVSLYDIPFEIPKLVPFNLHSILIADYGVDPRQSLIPALQIGLIRDVISDLGTPNADDPYSVLQMGLQTPVPTVTALYTLQETEIGLTSTLLPSSTSTVSLPTQANPSATRTATVGPSQTQSAQFTPTTNPQPTLTQIRPSNDPTDTPAPPTQTSIPPTATPTSTKKPPTATQPPPTATAQPPQPTDTPNPYPYP